MFVHILAAIVLVGGSLIGPLLGQSMKRAPWVAALRAHPGVAAAVSKASGPSAAVVVLAGVAMVFMRWSFGTGWIAVSLVLFALAGGLMTAGEQPVLNRLVAAVDDAPDGPVTSGMLALIHDSKLNGAHNLLLTVDVAIVALMTIKPALALSFGLGVAAILAGAGIMLAAARNASTSVFSPVRPLVVELILAVGVVSAVVLLRTQAARTPSGPFELAARGPATSGPVSG